MNTDIFAQLNIDSYLTHQIHTYPQTLHVETKEHRRVFATKHRTKYVPTQQMQRTN